MNLYDALAGDEGRGPLRIAGVVVAVVTNTKDPKNMGRVKVKFPWLSDNDESNWARVAAPMAGKGRGAYFPPEVHDEVLVAFEQGDVRFPYLLGALWNGKDEPPAANDDGKNDVRVIKSRSGHLIRLTDKDGEEKIEIIDMTGKNSIVFDSKAKTITVTSDQDITLSAPNGAIKLDAKTVEIKSSADAKVEAGQGLDVKAANEMNLKGATINLN
jgi:uncharacterized protein involved in type VI secretion and phage assembly